MTFNISSVSATLQKENLNVVSQYFKRETETKSHDALKRNFYLVAQYEGKQQK